MKNTVIFYLDSEEKIILEYQGPLTELSCCDKGTISLFQQDHISILSTSEVRDDMGQLHSLLTQALSKCLLLHPSLTSDIGYLYNQYSYYLSTMNNVSAGIKGFIDEKVSGGVRWVGMGYYLWGDKGGISWLYNDESGNIIFEVTPFYPFMSMNPKKVKNYVAYEEWIKGYKPHFKTIISRKTAQRWLEQAQTIVQQIKENIARWQVKER